jgi:glutamate racemase
VPLIEAGDLHAPALHAAAREYVAPLREAGVDTVVLGCTHYPLLRPLLSELLPPEVRLVDPAEAAVQRLGPLLASLGDVPEGERSSEPVLAPLQRTRLCVTGCADAFARSAAAWLDSCPRVERVALT